MAVEIKTNVSSMTAQRHLSANQADKDKATLRLASGSRINTAADDAAGLSISSNLNARARSVRQAIRNTQDGVSLLQTTEGSMQETANILVRMRELGIHAASDTISDTERSMINREVQQLAQELDRISSSAEYDGRKLLNGGGAWPELEIQVGETAGDESRIEINRQSLNTGTERLGLWGIDFSNKEDARDFLENIDSAINTISSHRATVGSMQNRLEAAGRNLTISQESLLQAKSRISDSDVGQESAEATKSDILAKSAMAVEAQANVSPQLALKLLAG